VATPDFVVVGHVVRDLVPEGWRLGGTATFAAVQAERLGLRAGVVTRSGADLDLAKALPGVAIANVASQETTTFRNEYTGGNRRQSALGRAEPIQQTDVPRQWTSGEIALIGPVCGEVPAELSHAFSGSLVGVSAQGWLRNIDDNNHVQRQGWTGEPFWDGSQVVFVSDEDIDASSELLERWTRDVSIVALTNNRRGARVYDQGRWRSIAAFPANEIDPTGAGDVFATAFLVRLHETNDIAESTRFASAAAACSIEAPGIDAIATRDVIEERMRDHQSVVLS
jgi:sugar/nucleoside kinase (ribokinase family)